MNRFLPRAALAALFALLAGAARAATYTPEQIAAESAKANAFFERVFNESVARSPQMESQLGIKKDQDKWDDDSDAHETEDLALTVEHLAELKKTINFEALNHQTQLSYRLFVSRCERGIEGFKWRLYNYPVNQMFGEHSGTPAFFKFMREDKQFYFPNTPEGKAAYLEGAIKIIDTMRGRLDELFITKPKAMIIVKAVEPFRERESGGAFYERPAPDGSRPGTYYVNLYQMDSVPKYEMEALAYHEGIPGHHMQIAMAQELTGIPKFRKFGGYTAYIEGWGLYCERIPKEMGFYADPYSNFGRLSMELWRAARLVVDTGIHAKRWTRQQTMDWLRVNTPNSERDILTETNRYIVMAGQATAYKIGMMKILELRELATKELGGTKAQGGKFDVREFHDVVLKDGAVPLDILEENVRAWIEAKKKA